LTLLFAVSPIDSVLAFVPVMGRAAASMARIDALGLSLDEAGRDPAECAESAPAVPRAALEAQIVLRGVTYTHAHEREGEGFTLGPIDLTVHPGEILFLVGGNGSGKTTLVKLLTGLYPPDSGTAHLGAVAVDDANRAWYREHFSAVFADGFLFSTLANGAGVDGDERGSAYLEMLGLEGLVRLEAGAFSTTRLSQGQLKRLALAAACVENRPVLVLDEWASYQDPRFKRAFYRTILPALREEGKTLIVISHDDAYFDAADRVVHLSAGSIEPARETQSLDPLARDASEARSRETRMESPALLRSTPSDQIGAAPSDASAVPVMSPARSPSNGSVTPEIAR
jgi:putative ATP-binding cassette transporter